MRKKLLSSFFALAFVLAFAAIPLQAEEHEYVPLLEQGKTWKYLVNVLTTDDAHQLCQIVETSELVVVKDTVINEVQYWAVKEQNSLGKASTLAYLREDCDSKKVYLIYGSLPSPYEYLLYDFNRYEGEAEHPRSEAFEWLIMGEWQLLENETLTDGNPVDLFTYSIGDPDNKYYVNEGICIMEGVGIFANAESTVYNTSTHYSTDHINFAANLIEINPKYCCTCFPAFGPMYYLYSVELADGTQIFSIPGNSPEVNALKFTAVDNDCDAPAALYDLNGRPVERSSAAPGLYIERQGSSAKKIVIK